MWDHILEIATRINNPTPMAAFASVLILIGLYRGTRAKKSASWLSALALFILGVVGVFPLLASTYLQAHGIYHVRAIVLGTDRVPVESAHLTSSGGGEPKKVEGGWEFDIPPQTRPADGIIVIYAAVSSAFLTGSSTVELGKEYYPTTIIQLKADTSATVRGTVVDARRKSVAGARVSISGYSDVVMTDTMGNFQLPAHAAEGQVVTLSAEKGRLVATVSVPAGGGQVEVVVRRR